MNFYSLDAHTKRVYQKSVYREAEGYSEGNWMNGMNSKFANVHPATVCFGISEGKHDKSLKYTRQFWHLTFFVQIFLSPKKPFFWISESSSTIFSKIKFVENDGTSNNLSHDNTTMEGWSVEPFRVIPWIYCYLHKV